MGLHRLAFAFIAALAAGCASAPPDGYTCCNLHYDYDRISDANWSHLPMIPAGAKIRVVDYGLNRALVEIDGKPIKIAHDYGRDRETVENYVRKLVVQQDPRQLIETYPPQVRDAIFEGRVITGMTREQVIIAAGYPPTHRTFTLDSNVWHLWGSKHGRYEVHFSNEGIVERLVGAPRL